MDMAELRGEVRRIDIQAIDERFVKCDVPSTGTISRITYEANGTTPKSAFIDPVAGYPLPKGHPLYAWLKDLDNIPHDIAKGTRVMFDGITLNYQKDGFQVRNLQFA